MSSAYYISLASKAAAAGWRCQVATTSRRRPIITSRRRVLIAASCTSRITADARRHFASSSSSSGSGGGSGDKNKNKKDNFDEKVLRPASRGELSSGKKKHDSGKFYLENGAGELLLAYCHFDGHQISCLCIIYLT